MKQILVLQNHRLGDTLQTTPLLAGLREAHGPCHITLVTNALFQDLRLESLVDEVIPFDQNGTHRRLSEPPLSLSAKYDIVREVLEPFRRRRFDLVIDVPADGCMHLVASSLENAGEIRGAVLSPARGWAYSHPEVMLLYSIIACREINRFNLVDFYSLLACVRPTQQCLHLPVSVEADAAALQLLGEGGIDADKDLIIALQPGASEERKRWGDAPFSSLARLLHDRLDARVVLCGSASEKASGEHICRDAGVPVLSCMGRTTPEQLAALLRRCRLLVTNDTGTMHVACAVQTPAIDISTGPVCFRETGPYLEGSIVIEAERECSPCNFDAVCHHYGCREQITPELVFLLSEAVTCSRPLHTLRPDEFCGTRLHRACFNDVGRLEFLPIFRYQISFLELLGILYAHVWELFYGLRSQPLPVEELLRRLRANHEIDASWPRIREEAVHGLADFSVLLGDLRAAEAVTLPTVESIDQLQTMCQKILLFGQSRPAIRHFTAVLELAIGSQAGMEPVGAVSSIKQTLLRCIRQVEFLKLQLEESIRQLDAAV
jgi:ADP-heptose:LPS heptosyltransferase